MKSSFVSEVDRVERPIKNVNKPERDIETSMLNAIMQMFIKEILRYTFNLFNENQ